MSKQLDLFFDTSMEEFKTFVEGVGEIFEKEINDEILRVCLQERADSLGITLEQYKEMING